ncbi:ATP-binding protein [Cronobacter turicensis]|uniref:AAA family ATPase n=1 Tax=Cronobacter turicensis TaxID=413502 RepID=UPI001D957B64|nr:AAA family ATPase [Cronobacter turicensis]EGT5682553.1 ATP-binding protein [Cronobacter turicensis]EGT5738950.1 ATP-binding protein [Cronobacter turicensis]ELY4156506.1 ATP-binding protein [Cronobacter turicensis]ELY4384811.1 ATP-binding protein [Cronobacter turicensis]ELY6269928.1 ATP-binding protein [Cronobacter turicensis]
MKISITSRSTYKGFFLSEPIVFNGFLCVITGKNGSGKTRLLESIVNDDADLCIDGELVPSRRISLIDISNEKPNVLSPYFNYDLSRKLAESVFILIREYEDSNDIPEHHNFYIHTDRRMDSSEQFKARKIVKNAEELFNKKMAQLEYEELELSIYLHKDLINCSMDSSPASLSQLTVNYYQTKEKKGFLEYKLSRGDDVHVPDQKIFNKLLGEESPHHLFAKVVERMFRGKFTITPPDEKTVRFGYHPKLILNSTGIEVNENDLSSGEKIIFWLVEKTFYTNYSKSSKIFNYKSIILIDEPDAHLHPQMVSDFYDCLNSLHEILNISFIFNTHSPTTVALCPNNNIFNLEFDNNNHTFKSIQTTKDGGISQLLEGVSQISINPDNSRQVYVENINDAYIYEKLYTAIKNKSSIIDPNITLSFISPGPKLNEKELLKHITSIYGDNQKATSLIERINGDGNCQQVIGMVDFLLSKGNRTVRGLIDWDIQNRNHRDEVIVLAKDYAYSIENIIYDPIAIFAYLSAEGIKHANYFFECEQDYFWQDALDDKIKLQKVVDKITLDVLGRPNAQNQDIKYMNECILKGDREYFIPSSGKNGHSFESDIYKKYPEMNRLRIQNKSLMYCFTIKTQGLLGWRFINSVINHTFHMLQK